MVCTGVDVDYSSDMVQTPEEGRTYITINEMFEYTSFVIENASSVIPAVSDKPI